jgi:general secretion pathway protein G
MTPRPLHAAPRLARGFTIIELLVVMAVLGVLAAAVMPLGETLVTAQKERELRAALREIRGAIDDYKRAADRGAVAGTAAGNGYPASLKALVEGTPDTRPQGKGQMQYFLRQIPRDPFADARLPAEQTWSLRSYASPPAKPSPGADVYDVHSSSAATGLDGSPYASW